LHVRIALTKGQFSKYILRKAKELGLLPGQPHILEYLETNDGCSQSEICEAWDLDKSTVSGLAERMERDGLIFVEKEEKDRRRKKLFLTPKGRELCGRMNQYMTQLDQMAFEGIPKEEQAQFMKTLLQIYNNLKEAEKNGKEQAKTDFI
ncbi:MAG: MarR family winged helix-turn-helix transcriptional regulator, partial [Lachnospiraceae bacterium]|nr:MarR family winged helix-turn-helix transcriptional regulator [Lachnospiraceae bacterium]